MNRRRNVGSYIRRTLCPRGRNGNLSTGSWRLCAANGEGYAESDAGHGQFLLITGEGGEGWIQAADHIAQERGLPLKAISVNPFSCDWLDTRFDWLRQREVSSEGAVLVRPDRHIARRSFGARENPRVTLEEALGQVLGAQQVMLG